jgi:hypothetical protein
MGINRNSVILLCCVRSVARAELQHCPVKSYRTASSRRSGLVESAIAEPGFSTSADGIRSHLGQRASSFHAGSLGCRSKLVGLERISQCRRRSAAIAMKSAFHEFYAFFCTRESITCVFLVAPKGPNSTLTARIQSITCGERRAFLGGVSQITAWTTGIAAHLEKIGGLRFRRLLYQATSTLTTWRCEGA